MAAARDSRLTRLGLACAASGVICVLVTVVQQVASDPSVPKDQWSYPLTPSTLWVISVALAAAHVLEGLGFVALTIARPYGASRAAQVTTWVAVVGFGLFAMAELLSGAIGSQREDSRAADAVGAVFGVATLLTAVGGIVAGVAILRLRRWHGPGAWSVLLTALAVLFLVTPANISGSELFRGAALLVWAVLFVPLGLAIAREGERGAEVRSHDARGSGPLLRR